MVSVLLVAVAALIIAVVGCAWLKPRTVERADEHYSERQL